MSGGGYRRGDRVQVIAYLPKPLFIKLTKLMRKNQDRNLAAGRAVAPGKYSQIVQAALESYLRNK